MSPSIHEIFTADARKYIERIRVAIDQGESNPEEIRRSARRLNHAAALAHQQAVVDASAVLQKTAVQIIAGKREWSEELLESIRGLLAGIETLVDNLPEVDPDIETAVEEMAIALSSPSGDGRAEDTGADEPTAPEGAVEAASTEEAEAEAELEALIGDLGDAVERLENDPRDREPLKAMLRRIRRLRELGKIEPVSAPDKALTAVEELILQIADLNATVGPGYLTVFRHAREVMEGLRSGEQDVETTPTRKAAVEVDELKDKVMETARRARHVIWVSELFFEEGPPIIQCPIAEAQAGSQENYFLKEATDRLDRSEKLRAEMLDSDAEQMRLSGESLANTLRHLRERAVAFNHPKLGRVVRRAAAALRAQLVRPPSRVRAMASGLGDVFKSLRSYLETTDIEARNRAVDEAESCLHVAILGGEPEVPAQPQEFDPDKALQQALALRTRIDERLKRLTGVQAQGLRQDLEALFDLIAYYVSESGGRM